MTPLEDIGNLLVPITSWKCW